MAETVGRSLRLALRSRSQALLLVLAGALLLMFCAAPLVRLLGELPAAGASALEVLATPRPWALLARSLFLAGTVTATSLVIGVPLGLLIARTDLRWRRVLWTLHAFPMFLPPFLLALGWFHLFGREGPLGGAQMDAWLFSDFGLIVILVLTFSPIVTSLTALALLGVDASLEEAARAVAPPRRVAMCILLPAARAAIALAAIIVFALTVSELGVPMFLRVDVYPAAVFARLGGISYAPGEAFALALPLLVIAMGLLGIERWLIGARSFAVTGLRGMSRAPLPLGRWRMALTTASWAIASLGLLPIVALSLRGATSVGFGRLIEWTGNALATSVVTSAIAASIITALSLVLGHGVARRLRGAATLDAIAALAFVTPASVLGIGLISLWNRPSTSALYGSVAILVIGYTAHYSIVGIRTIASVIRQSPVNYEEAAAAAGANAWRRLIRIVLPVNLRGVMAGWLLAMVFCLRDLDSAVLYYPAGGEPLPVRIFTLEANGPGSIVAALALTHVLLTATVLILGMWLLMRKMSR